MKKQTRRTITLTVLGLTGALLFGMFIGKCAKAEDESYSKFIQEHIEMREKADNSLLGY